MTPLTPEMEVYRALLKDYKPSIDAFRLRPSLPGRPAENSLSIARTELKARGTLRCKGYAILTVGGIEAIPGLSVQMKRPELQDDPQNPDPDLLEVIGLPLATALENEINDYAEALLKAVVSYTSFDRPIKLLPVTLAAEANP